VRLAEEGDHQGIKIIQRACQELGDMALTVITKLDLINTGFSLILSGGVLKNSIIHRQLIASLTSTCTRLTVIVPNDQPLCANLRYGLMMAGINNDIILNELAKQLHHSSNVPES